VACRLVATAALSMCRWALARAVLAALCLWRLVRLALLLAALCLCLAAAAAAAAATSSLVAAAAPRLAAAHFRSHLVLARLVQVAKRWS
jgi:hypothetical protein